MRLQTVVMLIVVLVIAMSVAAIPAYGQFKVIYNFGSGGNSDPCQPQNSGIIAQGEDGNLYTTTTSCGANDGGSAIQVTPAGTLTDIYDFSTPGGAIFSPFSGLTLDPSTGNFYGTTQGGGTSDDGTLFTITPGGSVTALHSFTGGSDGYTVDAPPIVGLDGNLYGTSRRGGNFVACGGTGCGVVYKMTPSGTLIWSYQFDITHGLYPYAPLVQGTDGNFYGTTQEGGSGAGLGSGTVFRITPAGVLTVLHNFCTKAACPDGQYPFGPLIQSTDGNFYGTTVSGGANSVGEVFRITPGGTLTVLHSMTPATDGQNPYGGLVLASDGNFYGTTQLGGANNGGTIFKLTSKGVLTVLYNFDGATGSQPMVTLVQHTNGILYGDTYQGGTGSEVNCTLGTCGVFYVYNASLKPFIQLVPGTGYVGSQIGILGQGFTASSVVKFNGIKATIVSQTATSLLVTVPPGTLDGYVTVATGKTTLKSVEKFAVHDSWGAGTPLPSPVRYPAGVGAINGKIYVVGGTTTGSSIIATNQVYSVATNKWSTAAPLPSPLTDGAGAVVNGILYVIGGYNGTSVVNTVYAYNPATNTWTSKATMPTARASIGPAVEKGIIYVIGGVTGDGVTRLSTVEAFNPVTNTWTTEASLPTGKSEVSVGLLSTTIVAADGYTTAGDTGDNQGYSASTNTWKALASDPNPRHDSCYGVINGLMYIAGGGLSPIALNESYALSSTGGAWTTLSPLPVATTAPGSATWNGQLFCLGGGDSTAPTGGNFYNNVQIYQP
ncbi:MAG TPA: choice-of-anchor tandem repeat GloVer-containing protein [Terriglobales bacterium]